MDGMPHSTGGSADPIGDAVAKVVVMQMEINKEIDRCIDLRREITTRIDRLDDETCASLLRYRYIMMMKWEEIEKEMNYCVGHLIRLHGKALQLFEQSNPDVVVNKCKSEK